MKINLGTSKLKKSYFPISFDSSTSCNFGEVLPNFCYEAVADSNVNVDLRSGCRFAPLSLPTFGKAYLHTYAFNYKLSDLYPPYNNLISQTPYNAVNSGNSFTYIPSSVPEIPLSLLWLTVLCHSSFSVYDLVSGQVINPGDSVLNVGDYVVDTLNENASQRIGLNLGLVATLAKNGRGLSDVFKYLSQSDRINNFVYPFPDLTGNPPSVMIPSRLGTDNNPDAITPTGCDYMLISKRTDTYLMDNTHSFTSASSGRDFLICFKLNNSGKLLRKIFMGLGYQIINSSKMVSFLPIYAYFKAYFSLFAPKRFINFEQTAFSQFMFALVNQGLSFIQTATDNIGSDLYSRMIDELLSCYYTEDTDYYSSQIIGLVNNYGSNFSQEYLGVARDDEQDARVSLQQITSSVTNNAPPSLDLSGTLLHTQSQQNILSRLTQFVNRRSVLGGKIADLLQSVFGIPKSEVLDEDNPFIGSDVIEINFSDVFSTAETSEGSLGEYAGKAMGYGSNDKLSVHCSVPSLVFTISVIVPRTQMVQGINPLLFHTRDSHFYNPLYDGLTLLPTEKLSVYAVDSITDSTPDSTQSFGNQALYAEYKMRTQGILNGDLSLLSTKATYDSFTMDKTIANYVVLSTPPSGAGPTVLRFQVTAPNTQNLVCGTMWRYIGRWLWLGNYDRIFVNNRVSYFYEFLNEVGYDWSERDTYVTDDNLILHSVVDLKINAPMLPNADSYLTRDLDELNNDSGVYSQGE